MDVFYAYCFVNFWDEHSVMSFGIIVERVFVVTETHFEVYSFFWVGFTLGLLLL